MIKKLTAMNETKLAVIPEHVAIIMDGNGRWAKKRLLPRAAGHKAGVKTVKTIVEVSAELGIKAVTLFAFSSENWQRPKKEVDMLMDLFITSLESEVKQLHKNGVRLQFIGDRSQFSDKLQARIAESEDLTRDNQGLRLVIAANYGGKWDISQAVQSLAEQVKQGKLEPVAITADTLDQYVCLADLPEPDLFIRTSGEHRISNFMIWQLAYTELYFTDTLWPDFNRAAYIEALQSFADRERRFGQTGEQVTKLNNA